MEIDFRIKQGANFKRVVNVVEFGVAKNISGYSARMQIRKTRDETSELLSDVSSYITVNDPPNGQLTINIPATVTEAYNFSTGAYDLEIFNTATGDVISVLDGFVSVMKEVTS